MDRSAWLGARRADVIAAYDAEAAGYREYPNEAQQRWVARLLDMCPAGGVVLDAPCGTGRYFPQVAAAGLDVVGIDQSAGMVEQARRRNIATALHHVGLQEMEFIDRFDAAMTIDAMENIPPEDWALVLTNLHRAVRNGGRLYLTVEEIDEEEIDADYAALKASGVPAVRGEVVEGDVAGYHFYPRREQVLAWFASAGWEPQEEAYTPENDWGYRHFLLRRLPR